MGAAADIDELVLTDEELAALTGPDEPRPVPLDHADALEEPLRRRILLCALRSLVARGLVASAGRQGQVVVHEPLAAMLAIRSHPAAIGRLEIVAGDPETTEDLFCFVGEDDRAIVETRSDAGMHRLRRRRVHEVAVAIVVAVGDAGGLVAGRGAAGGEWTAETPAGGRAIDDPEVGAALRSAAAVGRLAVRHRAGTQASLSVVVAASQLWVVLGDDGAPTPTASAHRVSASEAAVLVRGALVP